MTDYDYPRFKLAAARALDGTLDLAITDGTHVHVSADEYTPKGFRRAFYLSMHVYLQTDGIWDCVSPCRSAVRADSPDRLTSDADYLRCLSVTLTDQRRFDAISTPGKLATIADVLPNVAAYLASSQGCGALKEAQGKCDRRDIARIDNKLADIRLQVADLEAARVGILRRAKV